MAHGATYVTAAGGDLGHIGSGRLQAISSGGVSVGDDLGRLAPEGNVYVDLPAATPGNMPHSARERVFVLDADGQPHRVAIHIDEDGALEHLVEVGEYAMDLADFVELENEELSESELDPGLDLAVEELEADLTETAVVADEESGSWLYWGLGVVGILVFLGVFAGKEASPWST